LHQLVDKTRKKTEEFCEIALVSIGFQLRSCCFFFDFSLPESVHGASHTAVRRWRRRYLASDDDTTSSDISRLELIETIADKKMLTGGLLHLAACGACKSNDA